jgi:hypothetical protein
MDAKPLSLGKIVSERQRFVVPIYQRTYEWTVKDQIEALFDQIEEKTKELLETGKVAFAHYMGALLLIPDSDPVFGRIQTFNIVDGQQRLTTFHICLAALRDVARHVKADAITAQLTDLILHNDSVPMQDRKTERYKLQPSPYDRALFRDLIDLTRDHLRNKYPNSFYKNGNVRPDAPLPLQAYDYFWNEAEAFITQDARETDPADVHRRLLGLSTTLFEHFRLIVITLSKDDDAQVIFQTLNSGGKPLAAMDLVRNDVFLRAARIGEDAEELMQDHWSVFEEKFWKEEQTQGRIKKRRIDFYLAQTLAAEQGKLISLGELYSEYRTFVLSRAFPDSKSEIAVLARHVATYRMLVEPSGHSALARLARRLQVFDVSTAYPAIFVVAASDAPDEVKDQLYELIASFVVRRAICHLTPKRYNQLFSELVAHFTMHGVSVEALAGFFNGHAEAVANQFPTDAQLRSAILTLPQYSWIPRPRLRLILEELEFASRTKFNVEGSLKSELQIEHLLPQEWTTHWPLSGGRVVPQDKKTGVDESLRLEIEGRDALVHTLGNLTLLTPPANQNASNGAFETKRVRLQDSLLNMNALILQEASWDETTIRRRADYLAKLASKIWPAPKSL